MASVWIVLHGILGRLSLLMLQANKKPGGCIGMVLSPT